MIIYAPGSRPRLCQVPLASLHVLLQLQDNKTDAFNEAEVTAAVLQVQCVTTARIHADVND